jgi:hypothetical protein
MGWIQLSGRVHSSNNSKVAQMKTGKQRWIHKLFDECLRNWVKGSIKNDPGASIEVNDLG